MIPLDLTSVLSPGSVVPRLVPTISHGERSPFVRGPEERHLRLLVDNERLRPSPELDAVLELGQLPEIDLVTTAPSPGVSRMSFDRDNVQHNMITVFTEHPDGSGVYTPIDWVDQIHQDAHRYAVRSGEDEAEVERRFLIAGSGLLRTDGVVLGGWYHPDRKLNVLTPGQALAVIGLYLRSRDIHTTEVWRGAPGYAVEAGTQRTLTLRTVMTGSPRWLTGCNRAREALDDDLLQREAFGLFTKVNRALRARDEVTIECQKPGMESSQDRILYHLDALLLWLGGAFDILATVADHSLGLGTNHWNVGWRRVVWQTTLASADANLHALTAFAAPAGAVIDLVAQLRNTIHSAPIHPLRYQGRGYDNVNFIEIPDRASPKFGVAVDVLGGPEIWGEIQPPSEVRAGSVWDPLVLAQRLVPTAMAALNAIMDATPVERLPAPPNPRPVPPPKAERVDSVPRSRLLHGFPVDPNASW